MITKVEMYDTDIGFLFSRMNSDTIFVSDWENGCDKLNVDIEEVLNVVQEESLYNKYIYSRDLRELKGTVCNYIRGVAGTDIDESNVMISSNASISGLLTAIYAKKNVNKKKILIVGPIYFTYVHMFLEFGFEIYNYKVDIFSGKDIDVEYIMDFSEKEGIGLVLVINPLYRTGIAVQNDILDDLCYKAKEINCFVVVDEAYGNFGWNNKEGTCCNVSLVDIILKHENSILFDSLAKRVFANGMKSSLIFGNKEIISALEKDSVIYVGSLSCIQTSFLKYMYTDGRSSLKRIMNSSLEVAQSNFCFYKKFICTWKRMLISNVNSGYFALIGIPKDKFEYQEEEQIAIELIETHNLLVIPYSRYNYFDDDYMFFSINLLMDRDVVSKALTIIGENFC